MEFYSTHLLIFLLALLRIGGLVLLVPLAGPGRVGLPLRGMLAVILALLVAPLGDPRSLEPLLADGSELIVAACREAVLGLVLGTVVLVLIGSLRAGGHLVGQLSGMSLAEQAGEDGSGHGYGRLFEMVGIAAFLLTGGHRRVLAALLDTFRWMPPGEVGFSNGPVQVLLQVAGQGFQLTVRATAPVLVALLLSALVLGILQRMIPQLNTLSLGFSANTVGVLAVVALTLGGIAWNFQNQLEIALDRAGQAVQRQVAVEPNREAPHD